ncbi:bacterial transcriptional activator domain-containing protein [Streptomyces sp. NPDC055105]|uniref:bacterial transcriptional activator domain-containing protein n=1 Tax=Streptomyces sp. NPDC055105 TaxID=3365719 RepID=UPI0037D017BE
MTITTDPADSHRPLVDRLLTHPYLPGDARDFHALLEEVNGPRHRSRHRSRPRNAEVSNYLERALAMVDGVPLGEHAASWMSGLRTAMQARIVDTAHSVASYRTQDGRHQDFPSARQACTTGLNADGHSETLYRALMRAEAAAGNRTGLRSAIARWQDANRHLTRDQIDKKTQTLVDELLAAS